MTARPAQLAAVAGMHAEAALGVQLSLDVTFGDFEIASPSVPLTQGWRPMASLSSNRTIII